MYRKYEYKRYISIVCLFISFVFLYFSFGGPSLSLMHSKKILSGNVAFVIDVSKSMDAQDVQNAEVSRLRLVQNTITSIISNNPGLRTSLTVFAGEAVRVLPFTSDANMFTTFLNSISSSLVSEQGTNIERALEAGYKNFTQDDKSGTIVLITDGGEDEIDIAGVKKLKNEGNVNIIVVGVGTEKGGKIPESADVFGRMRYKTYQGNYIVVKLNKTVIKSLADSLGGRSFFLSNIDEREPLQKLISNNIVTSKSHQLENSFLISHYTIILSFVFFLFFLYIIFTNKRQIG